MIFIDITTKKGVGKKILVNPNSNDLAPIETFCQRKDKEGVCELEDHVHEVCFSQFGHLPRP